jgi:arylsulfatase A-like enzyme
MITIDALRADVVLDRPHASSFPFVSDLRKTGATFTRAISPGSQTSVSLSTMFSGRYFSQLYWTRHGTGSSRYLYPAEDRTPRFPEILAQHGVMTALFGGTNFLATDFGVARGFQESKVPSTRKHGSANDVLGPLIARLQATGDDPTFLYAHIMEPHAPYDRGKRKGTDFERYVSEVNVADSHVARVARVLRQRFPDRGVLIVSADHGEAFGEHGTYQHTKTLYDELLRVPLFIRGAEVRPRRIDARVSLVDIGPTLLDIFGVDTPPAFMGESLVPMLRGEEPRVTRPIVAEGRLRRALYLDGVKVIEDTRRKVVEAYDLGRDPGELVNLFDTADPRAGAALVALRAFFEAHALRRPGYSPPYKP